MNLRQFWQHISPSLLLGVLVSSTIPVSAQTITTFSVDPASPAIDGVTPDDVLEPDQPDPAIFIEGKALGLTDTFDTGFFDNLNALSYGRDRIQNPFYFSVDRVAIGLPGTDVNSEAQPDGEAAGDVYITLPPFPSGTIDFEGDTFPKGNNSLVIEEQELGLDPGFLDPDGDDLDGLDIDTEPNPEFTFFSVDFLIFSDVGELGKGGDRAFDLSRLDFQVGVELGEVVVAADFGDNGHSVESGQKTALDV